VPKPPARATLCASFGSIQQAVDAVTALIHRRVVPACIELVDTDSIRAVEAYLNKQVVATGAAAQLIVECDGARAAVEEEIAQVSEACRDAGTLELRRAASEAERDDVWSVRRQLSLALRATGLLKINHDVVVPRGRIAALFDVIAAVKTKYQLQVAAFGHAGDGNIHVNLMIDRADETARARAKRAERELFEQVVALEGSISGEHGIGFAKAPYLAIELSPDVIALMQRVKSAFDPNGILNPGKIFP
jgi:glycolate oxidase